MLLVVFQGASLVPGPGPVAPSEMALRDGRYKYNSREIVIQVQQKRKKYNEVKCRVGALEVSTLAETQDKHWKKATTGEVEKLESLRHDKRFDSD